MLWLIGIVGKERRKNNAINGDDKMDENIFDLQNLKNMVKTNHPQFENIFERQNAINYLKIKGVEIND